MARAWDTGRRQLQVYYALASPAIFLELALIITSFSDYYGMLASAQARLSPSWSPSPFINTILQIAAVLPWILVLASAYALFAARPSALIIFQTLLFLFFASTVGQVEFFQAMSLVLTSFLILLGFNYLRSAKVLAGHELRSESQGPALLGKITMGFDLLLPISFAIGAMGIVALVMNMIQAQVRLLPQPIATLGTEYLQSNFYLILTTISVAGGVVWAIRELLEPIVMRFTMSKADAKEIAFSQISDIAQKTWWASTRKPRPGMRRFYLSLTTAILILLIIVSAAGPDLVLSNVLPVFGIGHVPVTRPELVASNSARNFVRLFDQLAANGEKLARFIMKLLWG